MRISDWSSDVCSSDLRAVRGLEAASGLTLFVRRGRGVAITSAGRIVVRAFRLARNELQNGLYEIAALEGPAVGRIGIGALPLARAKLLPPAVARFPAAQPEVQIGLVAGQQAGPPEQLSGGEERKKT